MAIDFENRPELSLGIYTIPEVSRILGVSNQIAHSWLKRYWDGEFSSLHNSSYSWMTGDSKAISFHTMMELFIFSHLSEAGVRSREIGKAHGELSGLYETVFPFAHEKVLKGIRTDGKKIYINTVNDTIKLDGTQQLMLGLIEDLLEKLDFDTMELASKFYPLGKNREIVVDPTRQFGHPVTGDSNIFPETLYGMYCAEKSKKFVAFSYEIPVSYVDDAIAFCSAKRA